MASRHNAKSTKRDKVKHSAGGRGPKKGGSGGKYAWGSVEDDIRYAGVDIPISKGDPNYNSEEDDNVRLSTVSFDEVSEQRFRENMERLSEFKSNVSAAAKEFLHDTHNPDEFVNAVRPLLNNTTYTPQIGKVLMSKGFDYDQHHRELVSRLLKRLVDEKIITQDDVVASVNIVLGRIHDYMLDVPNVNDYVDGYVKRGANDGIIPEEKAQSYYEILGTSSKKDKVKDLKQKVHAVIQEFFTSEDIDNLLDSIAKLDASHYHKFVVKYAVSMALDQHNRERELVCRFLARTHDDEIDTPQLKRHQVAAGFTLLLEQLEDLSEDVPGVDKLLASFIARAIQDECLAPSFLDNSPFLEGDVAYPVLQQARKMREQKHSGEKLARVWGPDPHSPHDLKVAIHALIVEFFSTSNQDAAHRSILELDAPHFHHEVVRQFFHSCAEKYEQEIPNVAELLTLLVKEGVLAETEIIKGLKRIDGEMESILETQPNAKKMLAELRDALKLQ